MNLINHINRQIKFSSETFGPGERSLGIVDHLRKELLEIEASPHDLEEWIDIIILGIDGAWRSGFSAYEICKALEAKQSKNEGRKWPDWRTVEHGKAIEHLREYDGETCEICGMKATSASRDIYVDRSPHLDFVEKKPAGIHYYCDMHFQPGREIYISSIIMPSVKGF